MRRDSFSKKEREFFSKGKNEPLLTVKNFSILILLVLGLGLFIDAINGFQLLKGAKSVGSWLALLLAAGVVLIVYEIFNEWFYSILKKIFPSNVNYFKWFLIFSGLLIVGFTIWNFYSTFGI